MTSNQEACKKDEISFQQDLNSRPLEVGSHFKVGGMWLGKSFQFK